MNLKSLYKMLVNKIIPFFLIAMFYGEDCFSQLPLPCTEISSAFEYQSYSHNCIIISDIQALSVENPVTVVANERIDIVHNVEIVPEGENAVTMHITPANQRITGSWLMPNSYTPLCFEKIEIGISPPVTVLDKIQDWIINQPNVNSQTPNQINPFDDEQISIVASISYFSNGQWLENYDIAYGFYYRDYERIYSENNPNNLPNMDDPNNWFWLEKQTNFPFRIRYTPRLSGHYKMTISMSTEDIVSEIENIEFEVLENSLDLDFIHVSQNHHYFTKGDGELFIPVGVNLTDAVVSCNCVKPNSFFLDTNCDLCYFDSENNPCCGLSAEMKGGSYRNNSDPYSIMDETAPLAGYLNLESMITDLSNSGANSFRFPLFQFSHEVEFEKLNNYYDRMYQAYELDNLIEYSQANNLKVNINMMVHNPIVDWHYGMVNWDWEIGGPCGGFENDFGWCYRSELGLENAIDFFSNEEAKKFWKKKLKYFFARYGYSTSIFLVDLFGEISQVGGGDDWENGVNGCEIIPGSSRSEYKNTPENRKIIGEWHWEMSNYIKNELMQKNILLASNYTDFGPKTDWGGETSYDDSPGNPCESINLDQTINCPYLDVFSWDNYNANHTRYKEMSNPDGAEYNEWFCSNSYSGPIYSTTFEKLTKPIIYGECGFSSTYLNSDYTGFIKDVLIIPFTGHGSGGMSWDENTSSENWSVFGHINSFISSHIVGQFDIGSEDYIPASQLFFNSIGEIIFLKSNSNTVKPACGVIYNKTWNPFALGLVTPDSNFPESLIIPQEIPEGVYAQLQMDLPPSELYIVNYYNSTTNELISSNETYSLNTGNIILPNLPTISATNEISAPIVFFTISKGPSQANGFGDASSNSQLISADIEALMNSLTMDQEAYSVYNNLGQLVIYTNDVNMLLKLSSGVYLLSTQNTNKKYYFSIH